MAGRNRSPSRRRQSLPADLRLGDGGYNLLVLMVLVTVMNIAVAVALPSWSAFVQREKEAEAIFRGLQYAEAIRVFQLRHGRLPITLDELVEIEPRAIRKLYPNPLHESGQWGLLVQAAAPGGGGRQQPAGGQRQPLTPPGQRPNPAESGGVGINPSLIQGVRYVTIPPSEEGEESSLRGPRNRTAGPLVGVYPATDAASLRTFFGQDNYSGWHFSVSLIPLPVVVGDRGMPRVTSDWIGKPFREDLVTPEGGDAPGTGGDRGSRRRGRSQADGFERDTNDDWLNEDGR
ncbi:MAG TPA: hypothetical protein VNB06_05030 [Thermoanaerobaculia bacterium]|nr:hypothetical protein [Thermoanaerobaculia bacterium]